MKTTVSAGGVIMNGKGQVIVVNQNHKSWSLPKGHVEENEELMEAAIREIWEETGISELSYIKKLGEYCRFRIGKNGGEDQQELKRIVIFLFSTTQEELDPQDPMNPIAKWVDIEEVPGILSHPKDRVFFRDIMQHLLNAQIG